MLSIVAFLALGGVTGLAAGYLGIGGGVILVPVLTYMFKARGMALDQVMTSAFATSLFTAVFTTGAAAWQQYRQRNLLLQVVPWTAAGAFIGGQGGAWLGSTLPGGSLQLLFSIFLLLCAVYLVRDWRKNKSDVETVVIRPVALLAIGVVTGVLAALFGVGGGILMVPAFIFIFGFPARKVAGTSSAIAFIISISAVIGYLLYGSARATSGSGFWGVIDLKTGIPILIGTMITAGLGARMNKRFGGTIYRRIFGIFLAIVALRMLLMD